MKIKFVLLATFFALATSNVSAQADQKELKKELEVMQNIFLTALRQDTRRDPIKIRSINSTYLQGQGVVFNMSVNTRHSRQIFEIHSIPDLIPSVVESLTGEYEFEQHWEQVAEEAMESVERAFRETAEELRELQDRGRDTAWEQRELEREQRDLEFQLRNIDGAQEKKTLQQRLSQIEKEVVKLKQAKEKVQQEVAKLNAAQKQKKEEQKRAKEKLYNSFLANLEAELGDSLCRYGAGLRALPKDEHITFVLENFVDNQRDRIYVFTQKNVMNCVQNKVDVQGLLSKASIYEF